MLKNKNDDIELLDFDDEQDNLVLTNDDIKLIKEIEEKEKERIAARRKQKEEAAKLKEQLENKEEKVIPKKEEVKKEEPKKLEPKKVEEKKVEPKKIETKKVEVKKEEPKKVEVKKEEVKQVKNKEEKPKQAETILKEKEDNNMSKKKQKRKSKKNKRTNKVVATLYSILTIIYVVWFVNFLFKINIIPAKYLSAVVGVIALITLIIVTLIYGNKYARRISISLLIINVLLSGVGYYYIEGLNKTLSSISEAKETEIYRVIVKKDSEYKILDDLVGKELATIKTPSKNYKKGLDTLLKEVKINTKSYENMNTMVMDLINEKIDAMLISENNQNILSETYPNYDKNIRGIKDISISVIKAKEKEYKHKYGPFNILISGIDTYGNINATSRSDVNIILTINQHTHQVLISNVPRDTYVQLHGTTGTKDKLTHAGIYGVDMTRQTLEDFLETEIPYYVRVNFSSVEKIIDAIGGVDIYNDTYFVAEGYAFRKGNIHLNGKHALTYARERHALVDGDFGRGKHQEEIINAVIKKMTTSTELLNSYGELMNTLGRYIQTNVPDETIRKYIKDQIDKMPSWQINKDTLYTDPGYRDYTYSAPGLKLYVSPPNEESRKNLSKSINDLLNKEK